VVDAEDDKADAVGCGFAVFAGAAGGGELIRSNDVFGAEIARAEAVGAGVDLGQLVEGDGLQAFLSGAAFSLNGLGEGGANVAAERVVAGEASSVRSNMMTFFLPLRAATMAASGKGRMTLTWMEPTVTRGFRGGSRRRLRYFQRPSPERRRRCRCRLFCTWK